MKSFKQYLILLILTTSFFGCAAVIDKFLQGNTKTTIKSEEKVNNNELQFVDYKKDQNINIDKKNEQVVSDNSNESIIQDVNEINTKDMENDLGSKEEVSVISDFEDDPILQKEISKDTQTATVHSKDKVYQDAIETATYEDFEKAPVPQKEASTYEDFEKAPVPQKEASTYEDFEKAPVPQKEASTYEDFENAPVPQNEKIINNEKNDNSILPSNDYLYKSETKKELTSINNCNGEKVTKFWHTLEKVVVVARTLNLRNSPGNRKKIVGTLERCEILDVLDKRVERIKSGGKVRTRGWLKIKSSSGLTGWVASWHTRYVQQ